MTDPTPTPPVAPSASGPFRDDEVVYVDPDTRTVVGRLEWGKNENPKSLPYKKIEVKEGERKGQFWRKFYPFGTYRSMKRIYKLEGKIKDVEPNRTLEEVLPRALNEAFWND